MSARAAAGLVLGEEALRDPSKASPEAVAAGFGQVCDLGAAGARQGSSLPRDVVQPPGGRSAITSNVPPNHWTTGARALAPSAEPLGYQ